MTDAERDVPPPLKFSPPDCPMCGEATRVDHGFYVCEACECSWDKDGMFALWTDFEDQCPETVRPWENNDRIPESLEYKHKEFRCFLGDGHGLRGFKLHAHPRLVGSQWAKGWR